jgi:hypothetical protein
MNLSRNRAVVASLLFCAAAPLIAQESLRVVIVDGDKAINIVGSKTAVQPVVEVRGAGGSPIKDAAVTFLLPQSGAGAQFSGGKKSAVIKTGGDGRAVAPEMQAVGAGSFRIEIQAAFQGKKAQASITQTNFAKQAAADAAVLASRESLTASLRIEILEGDDGVNILDKNTAVAPIVRVVDKNNLPVAGVAVVVTVVAMSGSKASFPDGASTAHLTTGQDGRAIAPALTPAGQGSFQLAVQASAQGSQAAPRTISQTNYPSERAALDSGKIPGTSRGDATTTGEVKVRILRGTNSANIVKNKTVQEAPKVEVTDDAGTPIVGAKVAFVLPTKDARAEFPDGSSYLIATTDSSGQADAGSLRPFGLGAFQIEVLVSYAGQVTTAVSIPQKNFLNSKSAKAAQGSQTSSPSSAAAATGMSAGAKALIAVGAVAGVAVGVAGAVGQKNSTSNTVTTTPPAAVSSCTTSLLTQFATDLQSVISICGSGTGQCVNAKGACLNACNKAITDLSPLCSSCGLTLPSDLKISITQAGLTPPGACR